MEQKLSWMTPGLWGWGPDDQREWEVIARVGRLSRSPSVLTASDPSLGRWA